MNVDPVHFVEIKKSHQIVDLMAFLAPLLVPIAIGTNQGLISEKEFFLHFRELF
jgi:hypothetical protein